MVATRWPAFIRATAICSAVVDLPDPPFSLPSTTTCAEPDCPWLACTSICRPLWISSNRARLRSREMRANALKLQIDCFNHEFMDAPLRSVTDHTIAADVLGMSWIYPWAEARLPSHGTRAWCWHSLLGNVGLSFSNACVAGL